MRKPKDSYVRPRCGYILPKEDATVSGYDPQSSLRHVHCACMHALHLALFLHRLDFSEKNKIGSPLRRSSSSSFASSTCERTEIRRLRVLSELSIFTSSSQPKDENPLTLEQVVDRFYSLLCVGGANPL